MHTANLILAGPAPVSLSTLAYCLFISTDSVFAEGLLMALSS